jgi:RNA polymerase primary sigma factor
MIEEQMDHEDVVPSYLGKLTQAPLLTVEEEADLARRVQKGDATARQRLIESNMRLVINIAKSYRSRTIPLEDLIQEGAIGLMQAVARFDPSRGFRFSTYATHWIRQAVGRALDNKGKAIRVPAHVAQWLRKIERERTEFARTIGREPSPEELAAYLGVSPRKLAALMQSSQEMLSLDMRVGDGENTTLGSLLRDTATGDPEQEVLTDEMIRELQHIVSELSERERLVMGCRLRMDAGQSDERDDLARELQISRERIRQIELHAIKKLRAMAQRRRLREMLS